MQVVATHQRAAGAAQHALRGAAANLCHRHATVRACAGLRRVRWGRADAHAHGGQEKSWFDTFSEYVSVGVTAAPRVGEISVSRPPGMTSATTGAEIGRARGNEQRGLLASVNGGMSPQHSAMAGMGSARVAESKPLFSCVMDSVTSAAAAAADTVTHYATGEEEGSRREGLLSVTGAGREPGGGSYHKI